MKGEENRRKFVTNMDALAKCLLNDAGATELVGVLLYSISKENKKKLSANEKTEIARIDETEENEIPLEVLKFLKQAKNKQVQEFVDAVKSRIKGMLYSEEFKLSTQQIICFSAFFRRDDFCLSVRDERNEKVMKMIIFLTIQEDDEYQIIASEYARGEIPEEELDTLYQIFTILDGSAKGNMYRRAIKNVTNKFKDSKRGG